MKNICKTLIIASILFESSCAMMFNSKEVEVAINSSPQGAQVYIDGQSYGKTPTTIYVEPKNYQVVLSKPGYGSTQIQLDTWQAVRRKQGDGGRCIADILGSMLIIPLYSAIWSVYCRDFKQAEYSAVIPYLGKKSAGLSSGSTIGSGQNPADMIPYYYGQSASQSGASQDNQNYKSPVASGPSAYSEFSVNGGPQPPQPMQMPQQSSDEERLQEMRQRMMMDKPSRGGGGVPKSGSVMNMGKDQTDMINYYYKQDMKKYGGFEVEPDYSADPEAVDDRVRSVTGQPELLYQ